MLALGELQREAQRAHLRDCRACADALDELRHIVGVGRALTEEDRAPHAPPVTVWSGIAMELGLRPEADEAQRARPAAPERPRRRGLVGAGALAAIVLAAAGVLVATGEDGPDRLAEADLALINSGPSQASGSVALVRDGGQVALDVDVAGLPERDGRYYELWLLAIDGEGLVSLGPVPPSGRVAAVPDGLDQAGYRTVDISVEPYDGDPAHSRESVLRGTLPSR